jgi:hypothetical protein
MARKRAATARREHRLRRPKFTEPRADVCTNAAIILERTHDSADALLRAYKLAWASRGGPRGMSTDDEQDLLRAMLVMAASGLDSMLKRLIREALPTLVRQSASVREGLEKFVTRSIRGESEDRALGGAKFLGRVLAAAAPQDEVIEAYIRELTGGSLQSAGEMKKVASALGVEKTKIDPGILDPIFEIRNKIIHELDINLEGDRRKRHVRGRVAMMSHANRLLEVGEQVLQEVDQIVAGS